MFRILSGVIGISVLLVFAYVVPTTHAQPLVSPNYRMEEHSVGNSGLLDSESDNYRVNLSIGDTANDSSASDNFQTDDGSVTTDDPTLSFAVNGLDVDFGSFSSTNTSVATSTFTVSNYTSYGYVVYIAGDSPSNGGHTIDAMEETAAAAPGQNQFGINLVANTMPVSVGANPDHGDFGFGAATTDYGTSNEYRYVSGEAIAEAAKSSGETTYTVSYIANVEALTPGGRYATDLTLICVGTF